MKYRHYVLTDIARAYRHVDRGVCWTGRVHIRVGRWRYGCMKGEDD